MFQTPLKALWVGRAIVSTALIAGMLLPIVVGAPASGEDPEFHQQTASHMGTQWHLALYSRDSKTANAAFHDAWRMIEEIDTDLTNYSVDSELNRLCRSAPHVTPVKVGEHLWTVLDAAVQLSQRSDGAFDVTIGPVSKLWRRARRRKRLPTEDSLRSARLAVGFRLIELHPATKSVRLTQPKMQLDLGGIAKGYAVDRALSELKKHGISNAVVNGGGDLAVIGSPPGKRFWDVTVAGLDPAKSSFTMQLTDAAVATSGDAWQYVTIDGTRYSHIIDPSTGLGTTQRKSATVVAQNCMQADSLASALCVLPQPAAFDIIRSKGADARIVIASQDDSVTQRRSDGNIKSVTTASFPNLKRVD